MCGLGHLVAFCFHCLSMGTSRPSYEDSKFGCRACSDAVLSRSALQRMKDLNWVVEDCSVWFHY